MNLITISELVLLNTEDFFYVLVFPKPIKMEVTFFPIILKLVMKFCLTTFKLFTIQSTNALLIY